MLMTFDQPSFSLKLEEKPTTTEVCLISVFDLSMGVQQL